MRVLFILEYYYPHIGGVERLFTYLAEHLADQGHEVKVITNQYESSLPRTELQNGVWIHRYPFFNRFIFTFFAWIPAIRWARRWDVIHTTSYNGAFPAFLAGLFTGKKTIITFHEYWGKLWFELPWLGFLNRRLFYLFEKFIAKLPFDRVVAVSSYTYHELLNAGKSAKELSLIYNGIDYDKLPSGSWSKDNHDEFSFLFFGRTGISKGLDILVSAIDMLSSKTKKFNVTLVLSKEPKRNLENVISFIEDRGLQGLVGIRHNLKDDELYDAIAGSSAVIIPSYSEGFCFAAVETIAIGTPLISSDRGALKEVVSGKYLRMNDFTARDLCEKMEKAMNGMWNTSSIKHFHVQDTVDAYLHLYRRITS